MLNYSIYSLYLIASLNGLSPLLSQLSFVRSAVVFTSSLQTQPSSLPNSLKLVARAVTTRAVALKLLADVVSRRAMPHIVKAGRLLLIVAVPVIISRKETCLPGRLRLRLRLAAVLQMAARLTPNVVIGPAAAAVVVLVVAVACQQAAAPFEGLSPMPDIAGAARASRPSVVRALTAGVL